MEKELFTLSNFYMGRDEEYKDELTKELRENAQEVVTKVNAFLTELGETKAEVTSGWRPESLNSQTPGASKTSRHLFCQAVDILDDKDQSLAKKTLANLPLLEKYGLYIEDPKSTIGKHSNWVHYQIVSPKSGHRVFIP